MVVATRREQLEVGLLASDKASAVIKDVASQVEALDGETADVTVTAEDRASADVRELMGRIDSLTDEDKQVILTAEASKLEREVKRATTLLGAVDGETFEATLDARNVAQTKLDAVQAELTAIDNRTADATVEVTDHATGDLSRIDSRLDEIDKGADAEVSVTDNASGAIDDIIGKLGNAPGGLGAVAGRLASPGGAIAAIAGGLLLAANYTTNLAIEADALATQFDSSPEKVSGLAAVLRTTADVEAQDLADIIGQMSQTLADSPELAETLGITLDEVRNDPVAAFIHAIDNIAKDGKFDFEELQAASRAFGEEGVRQVAAVVAAVGPDGLSGAIEALPDDALIDQEEIDSAREFQQEMTALKMNLSAIGQELGGPILGALSGMAALAADIAGPIADAWNFISQPIGGESDRTLEFVQAVTDGLREGLTLREAWDAAPDTGSEEGFRTFEASIGRVNDAIAAGVPLVEAWNVVFGSGGEIAARFADDLGLAQESASEATSDLNAEIAAQTEELTDQAEALQESIDQTLALAEAQMSTADANLEVRDATRDAQDAYEDYLALDPAAAEREREEALDRVVRSAADVADATEEQTRATLAARGATLSAVGALDIQNESLIRQAGQMEGDSRDAILGYIADLNGIPPETVAEIRTLLNEGDIVGAINRLNGASATRTAYVKAETDQKALASVEYALANVARDRQAKVVVRRIGEFFGRATGDPYTARGQYLVGEQGPELVTLPMGSRIDTAGQTNGATAVAARVTNNYVTINAPTGTRPADILNAQRRYERIQGPS